MHTYYLGVDQSLRSPGLAVVDEHGLIRCSANLKNTLKGAERLALIRDWLLLTLKKYPPAHAALEGYSMESVNRPFDLGEVGGLVRLALYDAGVPFLVVPPSQLKKFVTGKGDASKEQVMKAIWSKWATSFDQDDQADAFGLAQLARVFIDRQSQYRSELEVIRELTPRLKVTNQVARGRTKIST